MKQHMKPDQYARIAAGKAWPQVERVRDLSSKLTPEDKQLLTAAMELLMKVSI